MDDHPAEDRRILPELDDEAREWILMTPVERYLESCRLWSTYLLLGGSLDPQPDSLLTFQKCSARFLLMGGQACILYGAAEFSRDLDLSVDIDERSLDSVSVALKELQAETIFVPPLEAAALSRGHACHFRCHTPEAEGLRIDIMSRMRGCDRSLRPYQGLLVGLIP